jgi:Ni2+-binding GTPase involved in maturation of urease and hydrogenase
MKVRDVMTAHPVLATPRDADRERVRKLMEDADVHHVPVVDGDELVGVWAQGEDGSVFLLGGDRVIELPADADADEAMRALMREAEVVLVRDEGVATGILTRADALAILRTALGRGVGRRHRRPAVIRVAGARGTGKTTLIMRTLAQLSGVDAVVLQANEPTGPATAGDAREVVDDAAHWRAGLSRAVARLQDAQLILVEDRDEDPDLSRGIGEDAQAAVIDARDVGRVPTQRLRDAQAIVLTHADEAPADEAAAAVAACRERFPGTPVFVVGPGAGDDGLAAWAEWVRRTVMRRRG